LKLQRAYSDKKDHQNIFNISNLEILNECHIIPLSSLVLLMNPKPNIPKKCQNANNLKLNPKKDIFKERRIRPTSTKNII